MKKDTEEDEPTMKELMKILDRSRYRYMQPQISTLEVTDRCIKKVAIFIRDVVKDHIVEKTKYFRNLRCNRLIGR